MKIWDFAYFLKIKTMGISPTLGFDTTTTPTELLGLGHPGFFMQQNSIVKLGCLVHKHGFVKTEVPTTVLT